MPDPRPHILELAAYPLVEMSAAQDIELLQLAQNESPFKLPDSALEAGKIACESAMLYPHSGSQALRQAIADIHQLNVAQILCGSGSMELISLLTQAYLDENASAVSTQYGYLFFRTVCKIAQCRNILAYEVNLKVDVDNILAAVEADTRMVFVANPGNPTGSSIPTSELIRLRNTLPDSILLVIDEAYAEYIEPQPLVQTFELVSGGNTVVLRTFSKIYGMAGLRVGWGYFPPAVVDILCRIRNPNSISAVSEAIAAAAIKETAFVESVRQQTNKLRRDFLDNLRVLDIKAHDSSTNFVLVEFENEFEAADADQFLRSQGIVLRNMTAYQLPRCLRATLGTTEQMERVSQAFTLWRKSV
ncbi:MAG: histidinol-phosphate aminotransferase [Gammaproteobacteria bacterium]|jgi:histidinol-phosphate aminotransferase